MGVLSPCARGRVRVRVRACARAGVTLDPTEPLDPTSGLEVVVPQNGGGRGWQWDEDSGSKVMPKKWTLLLDWLLQGPDRDPKHQL